MLPEPLPHTLFLIQIVPSNRKHSFTPNTSNFRQKQHGFSDEKPLLKTYKFLWTKMHLTD